MKLNDSSSLGWYRLLSCQILRPGIGKALHPALLAHCYKFEPIKMPQACTIITTSVIGSHRLNVFKLPTSHSIHTGVSGLTACLLLITDMNTYWKASMFSSPCPVIQHTHIWKLKLWNRCETVDRKGSFV